MSNLLKATSVICKENTRVIDSNELVALKIEKLAETMRQAENLDPEGFQAGLTADRVELLLEEQPQAEADEPEVLPEELLEQARTEAEEILEQAKKEAEHIKKTAFKEGKQEGHNEGYRIGMEEAEAIQQQLREKEQELTADYEERLQELEPQLVDTVADIFEHVFCIQFAAERNMILHILQGALGKINNSKEFLIRISKEDYPTVNKNKGNILEGVSNAVNVEIIEDVTMSKNQCIVETDGGVFDCSLDIQMDALIKAIKILSYV